MNIGIIEVIDGDDKKYPLFNGEYYGSKSPIEPAELTINLEEGTARLEGGYEVEGKGYNVTETEWDGRTIHIPVRINFIDKDNLKAMCEDIFPLVEKFLNEGSIDEDDVYKIRRIMGEYEYESMKNESEIAYRYIRDSLDNFHNEVVRLYLGNIIAYIERSDIDGEYELIDVIEEELGVDDLSEASEEDILEAIIEILDSSPTFQNMEHLMDDLLVSDAETHGAYSVLKVVARRILKLLKEENYI